MDFSLTEEQALIRDTVRDFVASEVLPAAGEMDRECRFPSEAIARMSELGLLGMAIPEAYGGSGLNSLSMAVAVEELARGSASLAVTVSVSNSVCAGPIARYGTEAQRRLYLPRLASGEILGGFSLTEPDSGSDAAHLRTRAERDGDFYLLTGDKAWVTNVQVGRLFVVLAATDPAQGSRGITAFLVERDFPGFSFGKVEDKMGLRSSLTGGIELQECRVPAANRLGEEGQGFKIAMTTLDGARIGIGAQAVGIARGCLEDSIAFARQRRAFGKSIAEFQAIQFMLADMRTAIDSARLLVHRAAWLKDHQREPFSREASMAKLFATEMVNRVAYDAVQIHGAYGYSREYPVERYFRDARVTTIYEGTSEIQRLVIARKLLEAV
ncbi:MAG TPA: acyl-CoA dehydrogenase [Candidatus Polarisedimenticolia bacterium]|jgi:alkylation response protein AidB-like acyl-CoA dehydrogenase|nr:acyl-CoA dehydrogenase [Candidatus Polarisedimenticolia bacterium]